MVGWYSRTTERLVGWPMLIEMNEEGDLVSGRVQGNKTRVSYGEGWDI